jgi:addiction module HigA family antidote
MLLEEFLVPMGVTQAAAARQLRISSNRLNELVRGKRGMTADTALRLSGWLGTTPQFWLHLQVAWDLWHAARSSAAIVTRRPRSNRPSIL